MGISQQLKKAIGDFVRQHPVDKGLENHRKCLVKDVLQSSEDPEAWLSFLTFEEGNNFQEKSSDASVAKLYSLVWKEIQHTEKVTDARWEIATRLGKHLWTGIGGEKNGRNHFSSLRATSCVPYMPYYREWALLEDMSGNKTKALKVINQALDEGIEPQRALHELQEQIQIGGLHIPAERTSTTPLSPMDNMLHSSSNQGTNAKEREGDNTTDRAQFPNGNPSSMQLKVGWDSSATKEANSHSVLLTKQGTSTDHRMFQTPDTCAERHSQAPESRTRYGPAQRVMASAETSPSSSPSSSLGKRKARDFAGSDESAPVSLPVNFGSPHKDLTAQPWPQAPEVISGRGACNKFDQDIEAHCNPQKLHSERERQEACNGKLTPIKEEALLSEHANQRTGLSRKLSAGEKVLQSIQQVEGNCSGTQHCTRLTAGRNNRGKQCMSKRIESGDVHLPRQGMLESNVQVQEEDKKLLCRGHETPCNSICKPFALRDSPVVSRGHPEEGSTFVRVCGKRYRKLKTLGQGGSSSVYQVTPDDVRNCKETVTFALKRCTFGNWSRDIVEGYKQEIEFLRKLKGKPGIIQLIDSQIFEEPGIIYMLLEEGEVDLKNLLERNRENRHAMKYTSPDWCFIRFHWRGMLDAVRVLHESRIIHSDLKPANFLVVKGCLKLIDFGIAKPMTNDSTAIIRETQIGTVSYMAPEALLSGQSGPSSKSVAVSRPSDIWSLGIILYQMVYGKTPFDGFSDANKKMAAIVRSSYNISFPPIDDMDCMNVLMRCLIRDPSRRITIEELLRHPFVNPNQKMFDAAMPSPQGKDKMLRALQKVCPELKDAARVSQDLFRAWKHDNMGSKALRPIDSREATQAETGMCSGYPEETHEGVNCPSSILGSTRNKGTGKFDRPKTSTKTNFPEKYDLPHRLG